MNRTALLVILGLSLSGTPALAKPDATHEALNELNYRLSPGVLLPTEGGSATFELSDHIGYGIDMGKFVVSPGLTVPFFFISNNFSLAVAAEVQAYYPMGALAPYAQLAAGVFIPTNVGSAGFFFRVGAGAMWFFSSNIGLGAELSYNRIGDGNGVSILFPIHLTF